jgi:ATP-dependent protease HslVU (ClpYQ) peptidase subunit
VTTIAWDGHALAADKLATSSGGVASTVTKIRRLKNGTLLAWSGPVENGLMVADWYERGAKPGDWPECQKKDDYAILVVVQPVGKVLEYETLPVAQAVEDGRMAWGSGRLAALGAMAMGAEASKAVQTASEFDVYSGLGVDTLRLDGGVAERFGG